MHNVADFLPQHTIRRITMRLALHQKLLEEARRVLPSYLRGHCQLCWIDSRGHLLLQVTGQEFAAQIRFFLVVILDAVRKVAGEEIKQVSIRTATPATRALAPTVVATPSAARLLADEARTSSAPEISQALSRLAATINSRCNSL